MSRRTFHSAEEWMQLVTMCRQSRMSDKDWCAANGINIRPFTMQLPGCVRRHVRYRGVSRMKK